MIDAKKAYENAKKHIAEDNLVIIECRELQDSYVFMTNHKGEIDVFPGSPNIQVMKNDGNALHFDMSFEKDPFEKIDMLIAAPEIDINELR